MYVPEPFNVADDREVLEFVRRYEFATVVSSAPLLATHIPVAVRRNVDGLVVFGHVARANPHWKVMDGTRESLVIFHGPHAYVSPTWYATAPAVPTWNYAVVHAYGRPRANEDPAFVEEHLRELLRRYEARRGQLWSLDELPADYRTRQLSRIVGFEMPVERLEAKFKLGQNRPRADRLGAIAGLETEGTAEAQTLAAFMRERLPDK
jgi:transcriptional regulator